MILSICIPTVVGREEKYNNLYNKLMDQVGNRTDIEILSLKDNKEISVGSKRDLMYKMCTGEYSVMIDDDDSVSDDYIATIIHLLELKPDCIGYLEEVVMNGKPMIACHSNRFNDWGNNKDGYDMIRTIFFKDVIRTDIAKEIGVHDMRFAEDHDFARRLKQSGLLKMEIFIEKIMYFYSANYLTTQEHKDRYGIK